MTVIEAGRRRCLFEVSPLIMEREATFSFVDGFVVYVCFFAIKTDFTLKTDFF